MPVAMQTQEMMKRIPYADIELQLEARGLEVAQFKDGAVHAYRFVAQHVSSRPAEFRQLAGADLIRRQATGQKVAPDDDPAAAHSPAAGGADTFDALGGCVDEHILMALRAQRDQHIRDTMRFLHSSTHTRRLSQ